MTTQCTLCGADGHAAKDCPWRGNAFEKLVDERAHLRLAVTVLRDFGHLLPDEARREVSCVDWEQVRPTFERALDALAAAPSPAAEGAKVSGCTCPSGDGSLRWPCPVYPAQPAEVLSDDLAAFSAWKNYPLPQMNSEGRFDADWLNREFVAFKAGRSRAVLAQPSNKRHESWTLNAFDGAPPEGYASWYAWMLSDVKSGARITSIEHAAMAQPSGRIALSPMDKEDGRTGYYFSCPELYIDVEPESGGNWSVYVRDKKADTDQLQEFTALVQPSGVDELRRAVEFLHQCKADPNALLTGATRDAYEWVRESAEKVAAVAEAKEI